MNELSHLIVELEEIVDGTGHGANVTGLLCLLGMFIGFAPG